MSLFEQPQMIVRDAVRPALVEPLDLPGIEALAGWLDDELEDLEERFRSFWTRQSLVVVLMAICYSRGE